MNENVKRAEHETHVEGPVGSALDDTYCWMMSPKSRDGGGSFRVPAPPLMGRDIIFLNGYETDLGFFFKPGTGLGFFLKPGTGSGIAPPRPAPPRLYINLKLKLNLI